MCSCFVFGLTNWPALRIRNMVQVAYQKLDGLVFNILNQTKMLFTAFFVYLIVGRRLLRAHFERKTRVKPLRPKEAPDRGFVETKKLLVTSASLLVTGALLVGSLFAAPVLQSAHRMRQRPAHAVPSAPRRSPAPSIQLPGAHGHCGTSPLQSAQSYLLVASSC